MKKKLFPEVLMVRVSAKQLKFVEKASAEIGTGVFLRGLIQAAMSRNGKQVSK